MGMYTDSLRCNLNHGPGMRNIYKPEHCYVEISTLGILETGYPFEIFCGFSKSF